MKRVIVAGGGITGLACAYFLRGRARVTLLEADKSVGGVIATASEGGFLVEGGPDAFEAGRTEASDLCRRLGIETVRQKRSSRMVLFRGRFRPLAPADGLLSWRGRLRAAMDLVLPRGPAGRDESAGEFIRRRLGREVLDRAAGPVLAGLFLAAPEDLSLRAVLPELAELERRHRSVMLGIRRCGLPGVLGPREAPRQGMGAVVERLRDSMPGVAILTGRPVRRLDPGWRVVVDGGVVEADAVVLAVPAPRAAEIVRAFMPALAEALSRIRYVPATAVSLGFGGKPPLEATGIFFHPSEGCRLAVVSLPSEKFDGRAPAGHWLARRVVAGVPEDAARTALAELRAVLGLSSEPVMVRAFARPEARPVYEVGHESRVGLIERLAPRGLHLAGAAYRGMSVPDCIGDARRAADRILSEG